MAESTKYEAYDSEEDEEVKKPRKNQKTPRFVILNHNEGQIVGDRNKGLQIERRIKKEQLFLILEVDSTDDEWTKIIKEEIETINNHFEKLMLRKSKHEEFHENEKNAITLVRRQIFQARKNELRSQKKKEQQEKGGHRKK